MYKPLLLTSFGLLAAATGYKHFDCGTDSSAATKDFINTIQSLHSNASHGSPAARAAFLRARDSSPITVPAVFHIVTTDAKKDDITPQMAQDQIHALNDAYNPYDIQFSLANLTWTISDAWAVGATDADDLAMKQALRQGTYATLNIYFQTDLSGNILGKCTLPSNIGGSGAGGVAPSVYVNDGCNVQANTMPNGAVQGYNEGKTAVHETGHWMGLLHVFEGNSCAGDGDFIADTPPQSTSTDGCPTAPPKDSCPHVEGYDAVHNYMDYSTDACYTGFTPLQQARMASMWGMYREGK